MQKLTIIAALTACVLSAAYSRPEQPKAAASPAPPDRSAEVASLKSEIANLKSELASALETRAAQVAQPDAPVGDSPSSAGVPTSTAALVAFPSPRRTLASNCAAGICQPAASVPKRYVPMRRKALLPWRR